MKDTIDKIFKAITVIGFAAIVVTTIASVFFRHVLRSPLVWGEELCRYVFVWAVMISVGIGIMTNQHISLDMITRNRSPKALFAIFMISQVFINAFAVFLIIDGISMIQQNMTITSSAMKISMSIPYAGIPIGAAAIIFYNILKIKEEYKKMKENTSISNSETDERS